MSGVRPYIVRQGDYVAKIAAQLGCSEDEIWSHEKNKELRESGRTKGVLAPGDVLYVPDVAVKRPAVAIQSGNPFGGNVPRVSVRLIFAERGEPRSKKKYRVWCSGEKREGTTDDGGALSVDVPVTAAMIRVEFEDPFASYPVWIGHVDPSTEQSGVVVRLRQLGYLPGGGALPDDDDASTTDAVKAFQRDRRLDVTGELDEATRSEIEKAFGS
ncbi:MAG: peptidoglycan-binding protein [Polyangiales bacterium]